MEIIDKYKQWVDKAPEELKKELAAIVDNQQEINDRFYRELAFGTGGLRGIIGAGSNRMNVLTVAKATQGLADYLKKNFAAPSVCIAYDTRIKSLEFAEKTAEVLCANGIKTYLSKTVCPTPMLSFAVRHLKASAGVVITASHNPKEYNGYKVYNETGGQITDTAADEILACINQCDIFTGIRNNVKFKDCETFAYIADSVINAYFREIKSLAMRPELTAKTGSELKILYSPLNGTGNLPVRRILKDLGFSNVAVVPEQELPDGAFTTVPYPNPEEPAVYKLAVSMARKTKPDLIFATDPDCDRLGVLIKKPDGEFCVLTGNQTGALLCDYILKTQKEIGTLPANAAVIKTIVTTELASDICKEYNVPIFNVLTGFKYIGELSEKWSNDNTHTFVFGFEESYGYLAGNFVRDKDAVIGAALIAEMSLYYKAQNMSLLDALNSLYNKFGHYHEMLDSVTLPGESGQKRCAQIIEDFKIHYISIFKDFDTIATIEDYLSSVATDLTTGTCTHIDLPKSNVVKFKFACGASAVLRPSGTEPKIKIYIAGTGKSQTEAAQTADKLHNMIMEKINQ